MKYLLADKLSQNLKRLGNGPNIHQANPAHTFQGKQRELNMTH